jgi:hypothetical protein
MKHPLRFRFLPLLLITVAWSCLFSAPKPFRLKFADDPEPTLIVSIHTSLTEVRQLQPVVIEYEIKHSLKNAHLMFPDSYPVPEGLTIHVRKDGVDVPRTAYNSPSNGKLGAIQSSSGNLRRIAPGGSWEGKIVVNLFHDMTMPGNYTIYFDGYAIGKAPDSNSRGNVRCKSNELKIVVKELAVYKSLPVD